MASLTDGCPDAEFDEGDGAELNHEKYIGKETHERKVRHEWHLKDEKSLKGKEKLSFY